MQKRIGEHFKALHVHIFSLPIEMDFFQIIMVMPVLL
jgi:hypothetical protein